MKITQLSKILGAPYEDINDDILLAMLQQAKSLGFDIYRLEKDFYLTIVLILIGKNFPELIFKGGTCLNKIYYEYYRLSEDLDFVCIENGNRKTREKKLEFYKQTLSKLFGDIGFELSSKRTKYDEGRQGIFEFLYTSRIDGSPQTIKVDIKIISSLLKPHVSKNITAIYQDPISEKLFFAKHAINVMDIDEIFAEKMRAALTRKEPAIRDFFDIWYAKHQKFDFKHIRNFIDQKVAEVDFQYTIDEAYDELYQQIETELHPVLKNNSTYDFNLEEIYDFILSFKK